MSITQITTSDSFDVVRTKENLISSKVGDLELLTTLNKTSFVDALNELKADIDSLVVSLSLPNQVYFKGRNAADNNTIDILKINGSDNIEFSNVLVQNINIGSGVISGLTSPIGISSGGTGGATASDARTALGVAIGTNVQAYHTSLQAISSLSGSDYIPTFTGSTYVAKTPSETRTFLSLVPGTNVQAYSARLQQISGLGGSNHVPVYEGSTYVAKTPSETRTFLSLVPGTNVQAYSAKLADIAAITPTSNAMIAWNGTNYVNKTTDEVKAILSLVPGTNIQAYNANLTSIGNLSNTSGNIIVGGGGSWVVQAGNSSTFRSTIGLAIGTNVQAYSVNLTQLAALTSASDYFIVGNGATWSRQAPATARASMSAAGLGSNTDITSLSKVTLLENDAGALAISANGSITVTPNGGGSTISLARMSYDGSSRTRIILNGNTPTYVQAESLGAGWSGDGTTKSLNNTAAFNSSTMASVINYLQNLTRDLARAGLLNITGVS